MIKPLFPYTQCSLDFVWLANGFQHEETDYGAGFVVVRANELHHAIAASIVSSPRRLRGQEARFLRTELGLSQEDFGKLLGVDRTTVVRWEKARNEYLNTMQDIAVRSTYAARGEGDSVVFQAIRELQDADEVRHGAKFKAVFEQSNDGWHRKAA